MRLRREEMDQHDRVLLALIYSSAMREEFYTTASIEGAVKRLRDNDLIDIYDMYPDGRVRWWLTAKGWDALAALQAPRQHHTIGPPELQFLEVPFLKPTCKNPKSRNA
jgi:DNA-binding MarR family transcriptional regulator